MTFIGSICQKYFCILTNIAQSTNGITWTGVATSGNTFTNGYGFDYASSVTITKPRMLALGTGGCDIFGSTDGNLWSGTFNVPFTTQCNAAAWNGSLWAAVGQGGNTIATTVKEHAGIRYSREDK
jgi:hypothetical protein